VGAPLHAWWWGRGGGEAGWATWFLRQDDDVGCCCAGYDLLKKKADALSNRQRALLRDIKATKEAVGKEMTGATFAISEAVWAAGDFRKKVSI